MPRLFYRLVSAIVGWSVLALQLYLLVVSAANSGLPPIVGVMKFFDYFTILSNLLVATVLTTLCLRSQSHFNQFFTHPKVRTGVAAYILITGLVYVLILRHTWHPIGLWKVADVALHYVMPTLYTLEWLVFMPRGHLRWSDAGRWLVFPLAFAAWALFWGAVFGFYPYPFIDVTHLGYPRVFLNSLFMAAGFFGLGLLLVAIDRGLSRVLPVHEPTATSVRSLR